MKHYWARIVSIDDGRYGSWVITDATTLEDAAEYIRLYHGNAKVREWLLL